jgi:hypothetical protein
LPLAEPAVDLLGNGALQLAPAQQGTDKDIMSTPQQILASGAEEDQASLQLRMELYARCPPGGDAGVSEP